MSGDEFEIVPKKDIEGLKQDVEDIKKDPLGSAPTGKNLSGSMDKLTKSMDNMFELFKVANKEIKEEASSLEFMKQIGPLFENMNKKMDNVLEQHDKIADGIIAIADLIKQMKEENEKRSKRELIVEKKRPVPPAPTPTTTQAPSAPVEPQYQEPTPTPPRTIPPPMAGGPAPMPDRPSIMPPG
jgi:hypothetical protein